MCLFKRGEFEFENSVVFRLVGQMKQIKLLGAILSPFCLGNVPLQTFA